MKTRHGMEIKQLLQQKRLSKSRFNQQQIGGNNNHDSRSVQKHTNLKKNDSASSLHSNRQLIPHQPKPRTSPTSLQKLQQRYKQLYQQYLRLMEQQRTRTQLCRKQSQQIGKYERAAQRDQVEIERLRSLMGFVNKKDYATQTAVDNNIISSSSKATITQKSEASNSSTGKLKKSRQQLPDGGYYDPQIMLAKPLLLQKNLLQQQKNINDNPTNGVNLKDMLLKDNVNSTKAINTNSSKREINYFKKSRVKDTSNTNTTSNANYSAVVVNNINTSDNDNRKNVSSSGKKQRKQSMSLSNNNNSISVAKTGVYSAMGSKKELEEKKVVKKYQMGFDGSSPKMAESLLYGSKSTNELRKRRTQPPVNNHNTRTSQLLSQHSNELIAKQSRVNSPNSKYKFIPSVDI